MTAKAKMWILVFIGLVAIQLIFYSPYFAAEAMLGTAVGVAVGSLLGGAIVAIILRLFWKTHTLYELWFASSSVWFTIYLLAKIVGAQ